MWHRGMLLTYRDKRGTINCDNKPAEICNAYAIFFMLDIVTIEFILYGFLAVNVHLQFNMCYLKINTVFVDVF